jgi:hypothetical protein
MGRLTPAPGTLHARLIAEARAYSPLRAERSPCGSPGYVKIIRKCSGETVAVGHRDVMRGQFGHVDDPSGLMTRPASD